MSEKTLLIVYSYHHLNTLKLAKGIADRIKAEIKKPDDISINEIEEFDILGLGSGIYHSKHHPSLLELSDQLLPVESKKAFLFSTSGAPSFALDGGKVSDYIQKAHLPLREKLLSKGYEVLGDFSCPGWNTNSYLKLLGGINKKRPNNSDINNAVSFVLSVSQKYH